MPPVPPAPAETQWQSSSDGLPTLVYIYTHTERGAPHAVHIVPPGQHSMPRIPPPPPLAAAARAIPADKLANPFPPDRHSHPHCAPDYFRPKNPPGEKYQTPGQTKPAAAGMCTIYAPFYV